MATDSIVIKRYGGTRFYCPAQGRYVSVVELRRWRTQNVAFRVVDAATGSDVTDVVMI